MRHSEQGSVTAVTGARAGGAEVHTPRLIDSRPGLPGGRAALGGLLIALAAVGVFLAYAGVTDKPSESIVVATRSIAVGEVIERTDLRVVLGDLPPRTRAGAFSSVDEVLGHVALGPIGDGEIVQAGAITAERATPTGVEVSITLPRAQIAVGRLKRGERVDVYVTYDDRTSSVIRGAEVVSIAADRDGSLTAAREISIVVSVPTSDLVAALVHALRTGEVTVVRSTFTRAAGEQTVTFDAGADGGKGTRPANG